MKIRPIAKYMAAGIVAGLVALPATAQDESRAMHVSPELVQLAEEFRAFRSPLFRGRTWRPNAIGDEVPDFAAVVEEQTEGLAEFRARLNALDTTGWPVHDQVDWLLLRAELDDVYFEHHILREFQTNAGFYVEHAINGVAREMGDRVPYGEAKAEAIIAAFERTGGILEQGPENIVFEDAAPELAHASLRHIADIREKYAAGVALLEPHFPESHRERLRSAAADAAIALEEYGEWTEQSLPMMQGEPNVGLTNMEWYFERVNFSPWNTGELLAMGEYEKNRFLMSIAVEEKLNEGLKDLRMPTTEEWIEWFRLTYLQTKYWLEDMDLISFHPYIGESYLQLGTWQEPFGGVGNRPGLLGFPTEPQPENTKRLFVVPEDHWFTNTYWERVMRLDPITDYQHSDWPGHYFEAEVTQRNACPIRARHRDTGFSQGWAHYWEELFLDMGYPYLRGPRTRELTYNFLLLRAVRIPLDIYLSTGDLTMDEAVQYQIDRVPGMEEHISRAEVDLYVRWPYQATSYIVGKKQIEQMLAEIYVDGDYAIDWREFHDELLAYGQIPLALVRWELTGNPDQMERFWNSPEMPSSD